MECRRSRCHSRHRKAAEVGLTLAKAGTVSVKGKGPGRHCNRFTVVGHRRGEVLDEGRTDVGARRGSFKGGIHWSKRGGDGSEGVGLDGDLLRDAAHVQCDRDVLALPSGKLHGTSVEIETWGGDFNAIATSS